MKIMNNNVTYSQKLLITVLVCILMAVMAYRVVIAPDNEKIDMLELEYDTAQMSLDTLYNSLDSGDTDSLEIQLEDLKKDYNSIKNNLYSYMTSDETSLLITDLFNDMGIEPTSLQITASSPFSYHDEDTDDDVLLENVSYTQVSASFDGEYSQIAKLIHKINNELSLSTESFNISCTEDDMISMQITLNVYMFNEVID